MNRPRTARPWLIAAVGVAILAALAAVALANRGQPITLRVGPLAWTGEAIYAIYAGIAIGLALMFLLGLPADLAARGERQRLARRVLQLERERDTEPRRTAIDG